MCLSPAQGPSFICYLDPCVQWEAWPAPARRSGQREKGPKVRVFSDVAGRYGACQSQPLWLKSLALQNELLSGEAQRRDFGGSLEGEGRF